MFKYFTSLAKFIHILLLSCKGTKVELFYFCLDHSLMEDTDRMDPLRTDFKPDKFVVFVS